MKALVGFFLTTMDGFVEVPDGTVDTFIPKMIRFLDPDPVAAVAQPETATDDLEDILIAAYRIVLDYATGKPIGIGNAADLAKATLHGLNGAIRRIRARREGKGEGDEGDGGRDVLKALDQLREAVAFKPFAKYTVTTDAEGRIKSGPTLFCDDPDPRD